MMMIRSLLNSSTRRHGGGRTQVMFMQQRCMALPSNRRLISASSMQRSDRISSKDVTHDVIIVGGGPTGLFLSSLLSSYQINSHLLFDKRPQEELLQHPQAHFINIRSMEILKVEMPNVHNGILREMPDVSEWEGFHFGGSVLSSGGKRLGRVVHPVKGPLRVGQSGNAILLPQEDGMTHASSGPILSTGEKKEVDSNYISACQPAHLAQNKFVSLLLEEAKQRYDSKGTNKEQDDVHLRYGEEVTSIKEMMHHPAAEEESQPIISIQTSQGHTYRTRYIIGADGVHSFARKSFGIPMIGTSTMQHLINVHFRTNEALSNILMREDAAMLYFVYNAQLVGAFVCHDGKKGEWVLQIPFFPPYQTMEEDFSIDKVRKMIWAGLGMDKNHNQMTESCEFELLSIRPWTMSSLVAQSYLNKSNNMILAGDAAHAFPPAGGFGMNTGLQDAHNLAWRLALLLQHGSNPKDNSILTKYESDRKPIATQNAALSVRNYNRTLRIAKACYLDAQHPALPTTMLGSPPMSLLPLKTRQDMFRQLVRVAMMPLSSLASLKSSLHANHIEKNVRAILESGGSLPLVFPKYEIGFSYGLRSSKVEQAAPDDAMGYYPTMKVGHRLPHVVLEVLKSRTQHIDGDGWSVLETGTSHQKEACTDPLFISLTDISSQLRKVLSYDTPIFTLLVVGSFSKSTLASLRETVDELSNKLKIPLALVNILSEAPGHEMDSSGGVITLIDSQQDIWQLILDEVSVTDKIESDGTPSNAIIMVRPDGHIGNVSLINLSTQGNDNISIHKVVSQGIEEVIGIAITT